MNLHEERARRRKAEAIADLIWDRASPQDRLDAESVKAVRLSSQEARDIVAREADQRTPSVETWAIVVQIFAERVKDARWGHAQGHRTGGGVDPFSREGG